ncbi:MAG: Sec-independent protein translocase subunit TatA [Streptosporangiaceae bacterium]
MIGDLFDSPWKLAIIAVLLIVLFGSKKLPGAARSLGQSMRILKAEVSGLHHDESDDETSGTPSPQPAAQFAAGELTAPRPDQQSQIDALQQQIRDMQRSATMDPVTPAGTPAESRPSQPS